MRSMQQRATCNAEREHAADNMRRGRPTSRVCRLRMRARSFVRCCANATSRGPNWPASSRGRSRCDRRCPSSPTPPVALGTYPQGDIPFCNAFRSCMPSPHLACYRALRRLPHSQIATSSGRLVQTPLRIRLKLQAARCKLPAGCSLLHPATAAVNRCNHAACE